LQHYQNRYIPVGGVGEKPGSPAKAAGGGVGGRLRYLLRKN
jgi:hypothetical protein